MEYLPTVPRRTIKRVVYSFEGHTGQRRQILDGIRNSSAGGHDPERLGVRRSVGHSCGDGESTEQVGEIAAENAVEDVRLVNDYKCQPAEKAAMSGFCEVAH